MNSTSERAAWWDSLSEDKQRAIVAEAAPHAADRACWCPVAQRRLHLRGADCRALAAGAQEVSGG